MAIHSFQLTNQIHNVVQNLGNYIHSLYMPYILNSIVNIISKKIDE